MLGACTTYWLARGAIRILQTRGPERESLATRHPRALAFVQRWGAPALVLSWVPVVGDLLVAAAGALRLPFATCSIWLIAGKLARYLALAWTVLRL